MKRRRSIFQKRSDRNAKCVPERDKNSSAAFVSGIGSPGPHDPIGITMHGYSTD